MFQTKIHIYLKLERAQIFICVHERKTTINEEEAVISVHHHIEKK